MNMENKICTTIEQSKKLIELGIDTNTADMFWDTLFAKKPEAQVNNQHFVDEYDDEHRVPAWSLPALLGLMPDVINLNGINYRQQEFKTKDSYCYCYADERFPVSFHGQPIDAAFEMVVWLKENNKI